jgi:hypothetical protein
VSTQPEALRLADLIQSRYGNDINDEAAAELRRQHAEIERLRGALREIAADTEWPMSGAIAQRVARRALKEVKPPRIEGYNTNRDQPTVTIKREVKP